MTCPDLQGSTHHGHIIFSCRPYNSHREINAGTNNGPRPESSRFVALLRFMQRDTIPAHDHDKVTDRTVDVVNVGPGCDQVADDLQTGPELGPIGHRTSHNGPM